MTIEKCVDNTWNWTPAGTGHYVAKDNVLELEIVKSLPGLGDDIAIEFKWNDNMQCTGDVPDFYVSGDTAPGGRFNYLYVSVPQ